MVVSFEGGTISLEGQAVELMKGDPSYVGKDRSINLEGVPSQATVISLLGEAVSPVSGLFHLSWCRFTREDFHFWEVVSLARELCLKWVTPALVWGVSRQWELLYQ